jgi:hypothetical protein
LGAEILHVLIAKEVGGRAGVGAWGVGAFRIRVGHSWYSLFHGAGGPHFNLALNRGGWRLEADAGRPDTPDCEKNP